MMIPDENNLLLTSDSSQGAQNVSADGSYFEVNFEDGLEIPKDALNINLTVEQSEIWWVVPNIIEGENDKLYITAPDTSDLVQNYVLTLPQGLYGVSELNQAILRELENAGAKIDPLTVISLSPDEPTQKVELRFNYDTVSIDFTQSDTFREIIGFNSQVLGPYVSPISVLADTSAAFNLVNYFLLHTDLVSKGMRINNSYSQTISQVLIDVPPGSQIVSQPFNPPRIDANELAGTTRTTGRFWITDDKNNRINTNGEYFTLRVSIKYLRPYVIKKGR